MQKNVLISGCSHSVPIGLTTDDTPWYEHIAREFNLKYDNVAASASDIPYSINRITEKLFEEKYDLVLFQLTDLARITIGVDGINSFIDNKFTHKGKVIERITLASYLQALEDGNEIIKYTYENILYSKYNIDSIINSLFLLQTFCRHIGTKLILIPYSYQNWGKGGFSIWNLDNSNKIDKSNFVEEPFLKWLSTHYNSEEYFLDNGYHLNNEGHRIFAYEYLMPYLEKKALFN